jgi:hypothetical protein
LRFINRLSLLQLLHLSKPSADRVVYQAIARLRARKLLEFGIGVGQRAVRMIEAAKCFAQPQEVRFIGVDLFEDRSQSDGPGLALKEAYRMLHGRGVRVQLIPGNVLDGLTRSANMLGKVDVLIFSAQADPRQLALAWFYVPRLMHEKTQVFVEQRVAEGLTTLQLVRQDEIRSLANAAQRRRTA